METNKDNNVWMVVVVLAIFSMPPSLYNTYLLFTGNTVSNQIAVAVELQEDKDKELIHYLIARMPDDHFAQIVKSEDRDWEVLDTKMINMVSSHAMRCHSVVRFKSSDRKYLAKYVQNIDTLEITPEVYFQLLD